MLQKDRHPNRDFFVADLTTWAVKDDRTSMEHPFFSLSKAMIPPSVMNTMARPLQSPPALTACRPSGTKTFSSTVAPSLSKACIGAGNRNEKSSSRHIAFWCQPTEAPGSTGTIWSFMP